jgi:hypothetical protein
MVWAAGEGEMAGKEQGREGRGRPERRAMQGRLR